MKNFKKYLVKSIVGYHLDEVKKGNGNQAKPSVILV